MFLFLIFEVILTIVISSILLFKFNHFEINKREKKLLLSYQKNSLNQTEIAELLFQNETITFIGLNLR